MTIQQARNLSSSISVQRLSPYRAEGDDDIDTFARYAWNICLCEAFYPALHNLEVALRNNMHHAIAAHLRDPLWLHPQQLCLEHDQRDEVGKAYDKLQRERKNCEAGRVIAELNFGFWTSLLGRRYDTVFWPHITNRAFPLLPHSTRPRHTLAAKFTQIRHLRNRVFHHEPIWNNPELQTHHSDVLAAIEWLGAEVLVMTKIIDRFPVVNSPLFQTQIIEQLRTQLI